MVQVVWITQKLRNTTQKITLEAIIFREKLQRLVTCNMKRFARLDTICTI